MNLHDTKRNFILVDVDFLENFLKEDWIILGIEQRKHLDLIKTEYNLGHANKDQSVPASYTNYSDKCRSAGI